MKVSSSSQGRWIVVVVAAAVLFMAQVVVLLAGDRVAGPVLGMVGAVVLLYCGARGLLCSQTRTESPEPPR